MGADNVALLTRQIGLVQAAIHRYFDADATNHPTANNAFLVNGLAVYLDSQGITDVRHLRFMDNGESTFYYDSWTGNLLPNPVYGFDYVHARTDPGAASLLWWGQTKDFDQSVFVVFDSTGTLPIFYSVPRARTAEWVEALHGIASVAAIAVTVAFPALAGTIGSAVLGGEVAAAYPALAQAIGQVAISTTLNGGDVQAAVTNAVAGGIGGEVGGFAQGASDSAAIGAATSAATKAAIVGGDIEKAAIGSLLTSGVSSGSDFLVSKGSDMLADDTTYDYTSADPYHDPVWSDQGIPAEGVAGEIDAGNFYHDPVWSADGSVEGATVPLPSMTSPPPGPSGVVATTSMGANLTQLAVAGLKLVSSWNTAGQPAIRTSNSTVRANNDGTITNLQTGVTSRMAPGTPYLTASNSLVTNNGDGTYTVVGANGQTSTAAYVGTSIFGSAGIGSIPPVVLIGGAAVLLLLLTQRPRSAA